MMMAKEQGDDKALRPEFDGRLQFYQYYYKVKENALQARRLGLLDVWRDELHDLADHASPYMSASNRKLLYDGDPKTIPPVKGLWDVQDMIDKLGSGVFDSHMGEVFLKKKHRDIRKHLYLIQERLTEAVKHMLLPIGGDDDDILNIDRLLEESGV